MKCERNVWRPLVERQLIRLSVAKTVLEKATDRRTNDGHRHQLNLHTWAGLNKQYKRQQRRLTWSGELDINGGKIVLSQSTRLERITRAGHS